MNARIAKVPTSRNTPRKKQGGGGTNRDFSNPDLARFTPRQLMEELRARGYTGELKYVQVIKI